MAEAVVSLEYVGQIIDKHRANPSMLIQVLLEIQREYHWLPREALKMVGERLCVPLTRIYQIATFYKAFSLVPKGRHEVVVCMGTACYVRGSPRILERVQQALGISAGETTSDLRFSLETVNCLGCCALGPVVVVDGKYHSKVPVSEVEKLIQSYD
jgi:NADH-quinone oxidoreductase subunit E